MQNLTRIFLLSFIQVIPMYSFTAHKYFMKPVGLAELWDYFKSLTIFDQLSVYDSEVRYS